jgi:hypothetical protein
MKSYIPRIVCVLVLVAPASQSHTQPFYEPYTFTTLAGNVGYGSADGIGSEARFGGPWLPPHDQNTPFPT